MTRPAVPTVDLHCDLLWRTEQRGKDPWDEHPAEMLDLPRMAAHGPSLQCCTLYTPHERQKEAATAYAEGLQAIWVDLVARGEGRLGWVIDRQGLETLPHKGLAGILTMEGASPLRGEIALLEHFYGLGVRSLGLTHNPRNEAGDGCMIAPAERGGLTDFGRELVRECASLGILIDVAHLAPEGIADLLAEAERTPQAPPVVSTHTGAAALTSHPRNLTDDQLRALRDTGGLAGITAYPPHVARAGHESSLDDVLAHIEHVAEVCGIEHVALGADLDGFDPPGLPHGADTPRIYALIEAGLGERGWAAPDVAAVLGGNALRVLAAVL